MTSSSSLNNKKKKKSPTLRSTIWAYFAIFTVTMLLLIWFFQVFTLDKYYEYSTKRNIINVSNVISSTIVKHDLSTAKGLVENYAYRNKMAIAITDRNGNVVASSDFMGGFSVITLDQGFRLFEYRNRVLKSSTSTILETNVSERFGHTEFIHGAVVPNTNYMIFIATTVEPVDSTVEIIKEQLVYISVLVLFAALWASLLLSKRLSTPISNITHGATRLAKGDYAAHFEGGHYEEIDELADTLNYASEEISKVENLRNDLIANVSHDLRTPLTMIKAYSEMIRDLSGENPVKRNEHLGVIIDEADRLSALVSSMLELSKLQSGNTQMTVTEFSLDELMGDVLSRYDHLSQLESFEFVYESGGDCTIKGDYAKLEQVMFNFVNNAVNYSGNSRKIIIRTQLQPAFARIEVQDFGKGIEKEKLPLIFDRYYRDERTKRDVVGSGLGLSIVKEILRLHKSKYGVQSEVGKGSTFWFEIPRLPEVK